MPIAPLLCFTPLPTFKADFGIPSPLRGDLKDVSLSEPFKGSAEYIMKIEFLGTTPLGEVIRSGSILDIEAKLNSGLDPSQAEVWIMDLFGKKFRFDLNAFELAI